MATTAESGVSTSEAGASGKPQPRHPPRLSRPPGGRGPLPRSAEGGGWGALSTFDDDDDEEFEEESEFFFFFFIASSAP